MAKRKAKVNLTAAAIEALPLPEKSPKIYLDAKLSGFGVRVTPNGAKSYVCERMVGGKNRRVTIAPFKTLSVAEARNEAQKRLGQMATGVDITKAKTEAKAKGITLEEAKAKFLDKPKLGEKSRYDYGRVFITYFSDWNDKALKDITPQMFAKRFTKLQQENGQATANKALRVFRSMWNYTRTVNLADGMPILPECPIFIVKAEGAYEEVARREATVLDALPAWFDCLENLDTAAHKAAGDAFKDYSELNLRTGLRASEAASMRWEDVDLEAGTFTVRNTKNGTDHTLPIVPQVAAIFERRREVQTEGFVFPANGRTGHIGQPRKYLDKHRKAMGLHWNLHDLRRSFATVATTAKIDGYTLKALLNHSRRSNDVTAGYVNLSAEDLRGPMQQINDHLDELAQGKA